MAQQNIDFGSFPDDPSADAIRTAFQKVQNNFNQLFSTNANSTVNSINRTPGAGVTVNYPTGNVVISANIACLQVATTSLKVGRGADNTQSNVTITSSSQQLNIDIDPENVYSNNFAAPGDGLANLNGTLTSNSSYQPYITTVGTLSNLSVAGNLTVSGNASFTSNANFTGANINFSNVSNFHIQGGTLGYYLQTDGAGNLTWAAGGGGGNGSPGGVNTYVQFNDTGLFAGNTGFTFNKTTGVLTTPSLTVTDTAIIGNLLGILANGNSNVNIPSSNGNVNISAVGNANIFVVTGVGANVAGNLGVSDKILANRIEVNLVTGTLTTNAQPNVTSVGTLTSLDVTGNLSSGNANLGNLASANYITGTLTTNAQPNITSTGTLTSLEVTGNANVGNINVANNAVINGNLSVLGNTTYINIEILEVQDPIISLGGGPNGDPLTSNDGKDRGTALQYFTTAPVTAFMGWDNSNAEFGFGSNVTVSSGEVVTFTNYGNVRASYFIGDNTEFGNANLGNTATANYFVGRFYGNANAATVANTVVDSAQPNITSVGNLTSLVVLGNTGSGNFIGRLANGNSYIGIVADSNISFTTSGNAIADITGTGINVAGYMNVTGNLSAGNFIGSLANGNSNVNIPIANGVVTVYSAGNSVFEVNGIGANVSGNAGITGNISAAGIKTDNYYYANGVAISFAGTYNNSNVASFLASFGSNTITTTGNVSVGNIIGNGQALTGLTGANVTGAVSYATTANSVAGANVSGAVSYATTANAVAGANVSGTVANATYATSAGLATYATTANAVAGANVSGAVSYATTANAVAGANVSGTVANATYATSAGTATSATSATTAGTVTTNAQPNITSTGTLTSVTVSGNITAQTNINMTGYVIRSVSTGISAAGSTQGTGTALTKEINIVSTVSSGQGVVLPTAVAGMVVTVTNTTGTTLTVYPASGGAINALGTNAGFTMGTTTIQFIAPTTTQWYTTGATYA